VFAAKLQALFADANASPSPAGQVPFNTPIIACPAAAAVTALASFWANGIHRAQRTLVGAIPKTWPEDPLDRGGSAGVEA